MAILLYLQWWYGQGWLYQVKQIGVRAQRAGEAFSGGILLKTLFSPWKQIITGQDPNAALPDKLRAVLDNVVSRVVGFWVRSLTLIAAAVSILLVVTLSVVIVVLWPLVPVGPIVVSLLVIGLGL